VIARRHRRHSRAAERGVTLVELLVTMFLMSLGFVSLLAAFSSIELSTGSLATDAQLTSQIRQVGDYIQSENFAYIVCGDTAAYQATLTAAVTAGKVNVNHLTGYTFTVVGVVQSSGGTHTAAGVPSALAAVNGCSSGPATGPDYGVQQIEVQVSYAKHSLQRIVYKRWN
jgi:Prokaryotic N-terminal methylation motif